MTWIKEINSNGSFKEDSKFNEGKDDAYTYLNKSNRSILSEFNISVRNGLITVPQKIDDSIYYIFSRFEENRWKLNNKVKDDIIHKKFKLEKGVK